MRDRIGLLVALLGCFGWACGGTGGGRGTLAHQEEVAAPAPTVSNYLTASETGEAVRGAAPVSAAVQAGVERAASDHDMTLEADSRLAQLASWVADRLGSEGEPPPNEVVEFFSRHLGLVEPVPHIMVLGQPADGLEEGVHNSVGQFMERQTYNRWGAAVVDRPDMTLAVVILSWRWVELEPIARTADPGTALALRGRLLGDHRNPTIVVDQPGGQVRRLPAGGGPDFDVRVPIADAGIYRIEVVGRGEHGDTVIANFPIYVGESVPESVQITARDGGGDEGVEGVRRALLDLINDARREAGVSEVRAHQGLRDVALAHSRDMVEHDFIGHTSPSTGTAADRTRAAHLRTGLVLENIGRGYGADEIHRGLLESPGHRANLVNADVTHIGIGVVAQPEGPRSAFVVTQVFTRMLREVDVSEAPAQVAELINRSRSARGAPPAEIVDHLSEAAQTAAEEFFEDESLSQQDAVDDASASLRRYAIAYRRLGGVMAIVADPAEAGALEPTLDSEVRFLGIGVAQGSRSDTGPNSIAVVIIMAWPR